jgi:putative integral membrane protein (TIGR02587 family)
MAVLGDVGATAAGGLFLSLSIAPTAEVPDLAAGMDYPHLLALVVLTLAVTYLIVFESGLGPHQEHRDDKGVLRQPLPETVLAYCVSLVVALLSLYVFDQIGAGDSAETIVSQTLVLALPTAVGGAAGRLVI